MTHLACNNWAGLETSCKDERYCLNLTLLKAFKGLIAALDFGFKYSENMYHPGCLWIWMQSFISNGRHTQFF